MHNDDHGPKERSSIFIFLPIALISFYLVYLVVTIPFKIGQEEGAVKALLDPPKPAKSGKEAPPEVFDHEKLRKPSEELIALGAKLYDSNCKSCHGATGEGNGTAGAKLAVPPRNFRGPSADWKNGASVLVSYQTLEKGLGSMPNFPALNPKQKYAVIHYVHEEFMKEVGWPEDSAEAIAALPAPGGAVEITIDAYKETRVPVDYAIRKMLATRQESVN